MESAYVLTGELHSDARSLVLDEAVLPAAGKKVRVTLQTIEPKPEKRPSDEVLDEIRARQKARGHVPPTTEEVERRVAEERNSWD